jgi:hypothetical protein
VTLFVNLDLTQTVVPVIETSLGLVFARSSLPKLRDRRSFEASISRYELVPRRLTSTFAAGVATSEAGIAVILLLAPAGPARLLAVSYAAALFILFFVAVSAALGRGMRIECGCFGDSSAHVGRRSLARLLGLIALATGALVGELYGSLPSAGLSALLNPGFAFFAVMTLISSVGAVLLAGCAVALWDVLFVVRRHEPPFVAPAIGERRRPSAAT